MRIVGPGHNARISRRRQLMIRPDIGAAPDPVAPSQFGTGQWSLTNPNTDGDLIIAWTGKPYDGGSPITALQYRIDGGTATSLGSTASTGSLTVSGLTNGTEYDVEIRAGNAIGFGPWSAVKSKTPSALAFTAQPSASASMVEPDDTITFTAGTANIGTVSLDFARFNDSDVTLTGSTYTPTTEGLMEYREKAEFDGYTVYSNVITVVSNVPPAVESVTYNEGANEADVDVSETGTVALGIYTTEQTVPATVFAGTGATEHFTYEFTGTSDTVEIDLSGVADGTYWFCWVIQDEDGALSPVEREQRSITGGASITAPTFGAAGTLVTGTGAVTPAWPTHSTGTFGLLIESIRADQSAPADPSGWAYLGGVATSSSTTLTDIHLWDRVAASGAESAPSLADTGNHQTGVILTWEGVSDAVILTSGVGTAGTAFSAAGSSTTQGNSLVVVILNPNDTLDSDVSRIDTGPTNADLTSLTTRFGRHYSQGSGGGIYVFEGLKATAGAFGATTGSFLESYTCNYIVLELKGA